MQAVSDTVTIVEVGPRDALQFESNCISLEEKIQLVEKLVDAGLDQIEVGGFIDSKKNLQLSDTDELFKKLDKKREYVYSALVDNENSLQRALQADAKNISLFTSASEQFAHKNLGCSIDESFETFKPVIELAKHNDIEVRGYLSCVFGCPYEGQIKLSDTIRVAEKLYAAGCSEISLIDTIGIGTPNQAQTLILHAGGVVPIDRIAVNFQNTRGQALANILASMEMGISIINTSIAGMGNCLYSGGGSGNVATEDVVYMLHGLGIDSSIDLKKIIKVGQWLSEKLNRPNNSRVGLAGVPDWILHS